jgi:hypothetical protein
LERSSEFAYSISSSAIYIFSGVVERAGDGVGSVLGLGFSGVVLLRKYDSISFRSLTIARTNARRRKLTVSLTSDLAE